MLLLLIVTVTIEGQTDRPSALDQTLHKRKPEKERRTSVNEQFVRESRIEMNVDKPVLKGRKERRTSIGQCIKGERRERNVGEALHKGKRKKGREKRT